MKLRTLALAIAASVVAGSASAAFVPVNYGPYTVVYDDSSVFGAPSFNSESGTVKSFGWTVPTSVNTLDAGAPAFALPQFFITANAGYTLSGPVDLFLGNFVFSETNSPDSVATTGAWLSGWAVKDENYGSASAVVKSLDRNVFASAGGLTIGTYSGTTTAATGPLNSFGFWAGSVFLGASGGYSAAIVGQDQNLFKVSLVAAPVPELATGPLSIAGGLALAGFLAWRRRSAI